MNTDLICGLPYTLTVFIPALKRRRRFLINKTQGELIFATPKDRRQKREDLLSEHLSSFFLEIELFEFLTRNTKSTPIRIILRAPDSFYYHQEEINTKEIGSISIVLDQYWTSQEIPDYINDKVLKIIQW